MLFCSVLRDDAGHRGQVRNEQAMLITKKSLSADAYESSGGMSSFGLG